MNLACTSTSGVAIRAGCSMHSLDSSLGCLLLTALARTGGCIIMKTWLWHILDVHSVAPPSTVTYSHLVLSKTTMFHYGTLWPYSIQVGGYHSTFIILQWIQILCMYVIADFQGVFFTIQKGLCFVREEACTRGLGQHFLFSSLGCPAAPCWWCLSYWWHHLSALRLVAGWALRGNRGIKLR